MILKNDKKRLTLIKLIFYWYILNLISAYDEVIAQQQIAPSVGGLSNFVSNFTRTFRVILFLWGRNFWPQGGFWGSSEISDPKKFSFSMLYYTHPKNLRNAPNTHGDRWGSSNGTQIGYGLIFCSPCWIIYRIKIEGWLRFIFYFWIFLRAICCLQGSFSIPSVSYGDVYFQDDPIFQKF